MKRTRRRKGAWLIGGALAVAGLAAALWLLFPRERLLTELAQPIVALDTSSPEYREPKESAWWLSASQLLIVTTDHYAITAGKVGVDDWHGHVDLYSPVSRIRSRCVGLTRLLNKTGVTPYSAPIDFQLSPNGTRLHWQNVCHGDRFPYVAAVAKLDGSEYRERASTSPSSQPYIWLDDRHVAESIEDRHCNITAWDILDVRGASADCHYAISSTNAKAILHQYRQTLNADLMVWEGPMDATHHLIHLWNYKNAEGLLGKKAIVVKVPQNTLFADPVESPLGSDIVYHLHSANVQPLLAWVHHFIPNFEVRPSETEGIWISRADGTGMHELGHIPGGDKDQLEALKWLPDGKAVSFVYHGMLYRLPINPSK